MGGSGFTARQGDVIFAGTVMALACIVISCLFICHTATNSGGSTGVVETFAEGALSRGVAHGYFDYENLRVLQSGGSTPPDIDNPSTDAQLQFSASKDQTRAAIKLCVTGANLENWAHVSFDVSQNGGAAQRTLRAPLEADSNGGKCAFHNLPQLSVASCAVSNVVVHHRDGTDRSVQAASGQPANVCGTGGSTPPDIDDPSTDAQLQFSASKDQTRATIKLCVTGANLENWTHASFDVSQNGGAAQRTARAPLEADSSSGGKCVLHNLQQASVASCAVSNVVVHHRDGTDRSVQAASGQPANVCDAASQTESGLTYTVAPVDRAGTTRYRLCVAGAGAETWTSVSYREATASSSASRTASLSNNCADLDSSVQSCSPLAQVSVERAGSPAQTVNAATGITPCPTGATTYTIAKHSSNPSLASFCITSGRDYWTHASVDGACTDESGTLATFSRPQMPLAPSPPSASCTDVSLPDSQYNVSCTLSGVVLHRTQNPVASQRLPLTSASWAQNPARPSYSTRQVYDHESARTNIELCISPATSSTAYIRYVGRYDEIDSTGNAVPRTFSSDESETPGTVMYNSGKYVPLVNGCVIISDKPTGMRHCAFTEVRVLSADRTSAVDARASSGQPADACPRPRLEIKQPNFPGSPVTAPNDNRYRDPYKARICVGNFTHVKSYHATCIHDDAREFDSNPQDAVIDLSGSMIQLSEQLSEQSNCADISVRQNNNDSFTPVIGQCKMNHLVLSRPSEQGESLMSLPTSFAWWNQNRPDAGSNHDDSPFSPRLSYTVARAPADNNRFLLYLNGMTSADAWTNVTCAGTYVDRSTRAVKYFSANGPVQLENGRYRALIAPDVAGSANCRLVRVSVHRVSGDGGTLVTEQVRAAASQADNLCA